MPEAAARSGRIHEDGVRAHGDAHAEPGRPRRTITITGHPGEGRTGARPHLYAVAEMRPAIQPRRPRVIEVQRRRPPRRTPERLGSQPDRIAMWAVMMALFLVAVTLLSSHI